jgi:hypothetical protein
MTTNSDHMAWLSRTEHRQVHMAFEILEDLAKILAADCPFCKGDSQHKVDCLVGRARSVILGMNATGVLRRHAQMSQTLHTL